MKKEQDRRIVVRGVRRDQPDVRKLARALLEIAQAQAEADAEAEHKARQAEANGGEDLDVRAA